MKNKDLYLHLSTQEKLRPETSECKEDLSKSKYSHVEGALEY